jgi:hypothetical protein
VTTERNPKLTRAAQAALIGACMIAACSSEGGRSPSSVVRDGPKVGQSGSEGVPSGGGDSTVPCPCGARDALRVTVLGQRGDTLSLRVEEVLHGSPSVAPGDVLEANRYDDTFACYRGCAPLDVGEQALAFYAAGQPSVPPCAARDACVAACDAENNANEAEVHRSECACREAPENANHGSAWTSPTCGVPVVDGGRNCPRECEEDTAEVCPPRPEQDFKRGSVALSPWTDPVVFARSDKGELSIPRDQLGELFEFTGDLKACVERFGDWSSYLEGSGY